MSQGPFDNIDVAKVPEDVLEGGIPIQTAVWLNNKNLSLGPNVLLTKISPVQRKIKS